MDVNDSQKLNLILEKITNVESSLKETQENTELNTGQIVELRNNINEVNEKTGMIETSIFDMRLRIKDIENNQVKQKYQLMNKDSGEFVSYIANLDDRGNMNDWSGFCETADSYNIKTSEGRPEYRYKQLVIEYEYIERKDGSNYVKVQLATKEDRFFWLVFNGLMERSEQGISHKFSVKRNEHFNDVFTNKKFNNLDLAGWKSRGKLQKVLKKQKITQHKNGTQTVTEVDVTEDEFKDAM